MCPTVHTELEKLGIEEEAGIISSVNIGFPTWDGAGDDDEQRVMNGRIMPIMNVSCVVSSSHFFHRTPQGQ